MTNEDFIDRLTTETLNKQFRRYFDCLESRSLDEFKEPTWQQIAKMYNSIDHTSTNLDGLKALVYLTIQETLSNVFDLLDNDSLISNEPELQLICDGETINGDLLDLFLAKLEDEPIDYLGVK